MSSIFMCLKSRIISKNMSLFLNVATLSRIWFLGILLSAYWYPVTLNARKTYQLGRGGPSQQKECNTLVLSMHLAFAFHEHKHHTSIHEHEHVKFHFIHLLFITCDVPYILTHACDHVWPMQEMVVRSQKHIRHT